MEELAKFQEIQLEISPQFIEKINQYLEIQLIENLLGYYEVFYDEDQKENQNNKII